jgi:hypothetical protein
MSNQRRRTSASGKTRVEKLSIIGELRPKVCYLPSLFESRLARFSQRLLKWPSVNSTSIEVPRTERSKAMFFVDNNSSFVTGSFYRSVAEAVAFHVPKTQLSESYTRMRGDCLNDHQVLQKSMVFTAIIGLVATISALFTMVLEFPVFWRSSWLEICIAFVVLMFVGWLPFVLLQTE